jgi:hypothetical protein
VQVGRTGTLTPSRTWRRWSCRARRSRARRCTTRTRSAARTCAWGTRPRREGRRGHPQDREGHRDPATGGNRPLGDAEDLSRLRQRGLPSGGRGHRALHGRVLPGEAARVAQALRAPHGDGHRRPRRGLDRAADADGRRRASPEEDEKPAGADRGREPCARGRRTRTRPYVRDFADLYELRVEDLVGLERMGSSPRAISWSASSAARRAACPRCSSRWGSGSSGTARRGSLRATSARSTRS